MQRSRLHPFFRRHRSFATPLGPAPRLAPLPSPSSQGHVPPSQGHVRLRVKVTCSQHHRRRLHPTSFLLTDSRAPEPAEPNAVLVT
eukprot:1210491-Rhodomonas_salina.1